VPEETASQVITETMREEALSEEDLATVTTDAWLRRNASSRRLDLVTLRRRLHGHLARRGFAAEVIHRVATSALARIQIDAVPADG